MANIRVTELHRRRARRSQLARLRQRYQLGETREERPKILEKARRIAPWLTEEAFLAPLKGRAKTS